MLHVVISFCVSFIFVWLKAFQQLNVMHDKKMYVMPISIGMAFCEVSIIGLVASTQSFWLFIPIGLGGGIGCITAMIVHKKIRKYFGEDNIV